MSVKVWIGDEAASVAEEEPLAKAVRHLMAPLNNDAELYHVLLNVQAEGSSLPMLVLAPHVLVIVVLANAAGPVRGGEKGAWTVTVGLQEDKLHGGIYGNPYIQARKCRFALVDILNRRTSDILASPAEVVAFNKLTLTTVAVVPDLQVGSDIKIPSVARDWFKYVGMNNLGATIKALNDNIPHHNAEHDRATTPALTPEAVDNLIRRVFQMEEAELVGGVWRRATPTKPRVERCPIPAKLVTVLKPRVSVHTAAAPATIETKTAQASGQEAAQPVSVFEPPRCIICALGGAGVHVCAESRLTGRLIEVDRVGSALVLDVRDRGFVRVQYSPTCDGGVGAYLEWLEDRIKDNKDTSIAVLHLDGVNQTFSMNEGSLLLVEPDWLINVTDLAEVNYCKRKLLVKRFASDVPGEQAIIGNTVHQAFRDVWRGADLDTCKRTLRAAVESQALSLVVTATVPEDVVDAAMPHVEALHTFAAARDNKSVFRSETFVLSPTLGLKGRIDGVWERDGRPVMVGELKTGNPDNDGAARDEHILQVSAYAFILVAKGEATNAIRTILFYSKNMEDPGRIINDLRQGCFKKVMASRNMLVRMDLDNKGDFESNARKCYPCSARAACRHIGRLTEEMFPDNTALTGPIPQDVTELDIQLFHHFGRLLGVEFATAKAAHARLWLMKPEDRERDGKALAIDAANLPCKVHDTDDGSYSYTLRVRPDRKNTSELRAGDSVILSGERGPMHGRSTVATVTETGADSISIRIMEQLVFCPAWVDVYTDESLVERMFAGLYRFIAEQPRLKRLLFERGELPTFSRIASAGVSQCGRFQLNDRQRMCIEASLRMDQFLLVNGPPGSGKTSLIAGLVHAHLAQGSRILIVASTNRALDQALQKIASVEASENWLRLGSALSAGDNILKEHTISVIVRKDGLGATQETLMRRAVVGATVSTLLSGTYSEAIGKFDLVIVDEATQSTIPATLGALSFATRFVLIGDPRQLSPIVQSDGAKSSVGEKNKDLPGLEVSLFEYLENRFKSSAPHVSVALEEQYRMNTDICRIPSAMWYEPIGIHLHASNHTDAFGVKIADGRLRCESRWEKTASGRLLDPELPFLFVNTGLDAREGARTNRTEAELMCRMLLDLRTCSDGLTPPGEDSGVAHKVSVAVISPYRAQVALIRRLLVSECPEEIALWNRVVDTVDRFQGSEADCVMISLCSWGGSVKDQVANPRRLNVAMTRARHKLIIAGCRSHLEGDDLFKRLFAKCDELLGVSLWCAPNPLVQV